MNLINISVHLNYQGPNQKSILKIYIYIYITTCHELFISALLICGMNRCPSGRVLASTYCGCWFDLQWWRSQCALLMRPNKVETAVRCSACRCLLDFLVTVISNIIHIYVFFFATKFCWLAFRDLFSSGAVAKVQECSLKESWNFNRSLPSRLGGAVEYTDCTSVEG